MKVKVSKEKFVENLEEDKSEIDGKDRETGND